MLSVHPCMRAQFCLESKIRHSTIKAGALGRRYRFCLESKIRHSTMQRLRHCLKVAFCLESKIRHSTIDTVPYFYVQRLIKKYGVRYFYQRSIC